MIVLVVDALIVVLLVAALGFAVVLRQRLKALQAGAPELERLIAELRETSDAAGTAVDGLRSEALQAAHELAAERAGAQRLADELRLLTDRAERAAAKLAERIRSAREPPANAAAPAAEAAAGTARRGTQRSRTELEQALNQLR